jgi:exosome complex component RRP45
MEGEQYGFTSNEKITITSVLKSHFRVDHRRPTQPRPFSVDFSVDSAVVHLGNTLVSCRTLAEQVSPHEDRPSEGMHTIQISSVLRIDDLFRREAIRELKTSLHRTRALDLESLVVRLGELVWSLRSEIVVLNNDGGLLSAMHLALVSSLLSTKLPGPREPRPIVLHHLPLAVTIGYLDNHCLFVDPTGLEATAMRGCVAVFANVSRELCGIYKIGGGPIVSMLVDHFVDVAIDVAADWHRELMRQMGSSAPPMLSNLCGATAEAQREEVGDVAQLETQIRRAMQGKTESEGEPEKEEAEEDEEDEEMPPSLLALFQ